MERLCLRIVNCENELFCEGRSLAKQTYYKVWKTDPAKMYDNYDCAILIRKNGKIVGNLNVIKREHDRVLPSEKYFGIKHWKQQCKNVEINRIAELCALAVSDKLTNKERINVFRGLVLGAHLHGLDAGISIYTTVQRRELLGTLTRLMKYPFIQNEHASPIQSQLPDDQYWRARPLPQLYYCDNTSASTCVASVRVLSSYLASGFSIDEMVPAPAVLANAS